MDNQREKVIEELIKQDAEESAGAYSAFLFWAGLPQSERADGEEALKKTSEYSGLEISTLKAYRVANRWEERTSLIDAHFFRMQFDERHAQMREQNKIFTSETKKIQEKALRISNKALDVAEGLIDTVPLANEVVETGYVNAKQPDGSHKAVPTTTQIIMKSEVKDIAPLIRVAVEIPNKVLGLPTEILQGDVVPPISDLSNASMDDLAQMRAKVAKEKEKLLLKTQNLPGVQ